jgi:hypothetical protein
MKAEEAIGLRSMVQLVVYVQLSLYQQALVSMWIGCRHACRLLCRVRVQYVTVLNAAYRLTVMRRFVTIICTVRERSLFQRKPSPRGKLLLTGGAIDT